LAVKVNRPIETLPARGKLIAIFFSLLAQEWQFRFAVDDHFISIIVFGVNI
jgi:hypothetical protein